MYLWENSYNTRPRLFIRWENGDEEIIEGFKPYFYVRSERLTEWKSWIDQYPVEKIECESIAQLERERAKYTWTGEANVPYLIRYAIDQNLEYSEKRKICYLDIEVGGPGEGSLDTENCPLEISLITIKEKGKPPLTFANKWEGANTITFQSEYDMLNAFFKYLFSIKPDIIAGWNIISYDLKYIEGRCRKLGLPECFYKYREQLHVHGTQSFDLLLLYKEYFEMGGRASLQNVAKLALGEEKKIPEDDFVAYNQWDTILCERIDQHYGIIDLMITFQQLAPLHISDMYRSNLIDAYILKRARARKIVLPTKSPFANKTENLIGAEILEPRHGVYSNVVFYDIRSAYPNILLKKRICHEPEDQPSLFLEILNEIYEERLKWRALKKQNPNDEKLQLWDKAFKFLLNAQTGQLGYKNSRYYAPHLYNKMTGLVRDTIRLIAQEFKNNILYADTDSAVFQYKESPEELLDELNKLMEIHNIPLEFEIDKVLQKIVFLGKKKNYFGLDDEGNLVYANMYAAQTACPLYCKRVLEEGMMKILQGANLNEMREYLKEKMKEIETVDIEELAEERNTREGKGISFNYKAWLLHKQKYGEAPPLPSKLQLIPLKGGSWIILTEKSRKFCEANIDRSVIYRKWIQGPLNEIMNFVFQRQLFLYN